MQLPIVQANAQPAAQPEAAVGSHEPVAARSDRLRESDFPSPSPNRRRRARHYVQERDNVAFLGAPDEAGTLDFGLESEVGEDEAGMLPFAKSAERDRLITNR